MAQLTQTSAPITPNPEFHGGSQASPLTLLLPPRRLAVPAARARALLHRALLAGNASAGRSPKGNASASNAPDVNSPVGGPR